MSRETTVVLIWINLGPYHVARMRALGACPGLEITAIQLSSRELSREWQPPGDNPNYATITLSEGPFEHVDDGLLTRELRHHLDNLRPDAVVVAGYSESPMRFAAGWAKAHGRVSILMSESQRLDRPRTWMRERLKAWWIRRHFDAAFVGGQRSADYLKELGFPGDCVWRGYDVVDNAHFAALADRARSQESVLRKTWDLPSRYFLYVGRLAKEKNLSRLLAAYSRYRSSADEKPWDLVMLGSGPLEAELKAFVTKHGVKGVQWLGFKQMDELPMYYGLASCLILPSTSEPWGLVINEALAAGIPVLASDRCGAAVELVWPGVNGYLFFADDVGSLSRLMERIASNGVDLEAMGRAAREAVAPYTPENWARALGDCVLVSIARRRLPH